MFGHDFYHASLRKYVILFGTLFNDIIVNRRDSNNNVQQTIKVPIQYAPREKMTARLEQNLNLNNKESVLLPRMSFEMASLNYAPERKLNTMNKFAYYNPSDSSKVKTTYQPVPYDILFELNIYTRYAEDATCILEQILPFFTPEWTSTINIIPELNIKVDVPLSIQSMSSADTYEGDFETRRALIWTLTFNMKGYLFGPIRDSSVIKTANVSVYSANTSNGYANTASVGITTSPGLDQFRVATSNAALAIPVANVYANDSFGYITNFEDYFDGSSS
jgi:hypothetical protein